MLSVCREETDCGCQLPPELRTHTANKEQVIASANDIAFIIREKHSNTILFSGKLTTLDS